MVITNFCIASCLVLSSRAVDSMPCDIYRYFGGLTNALVRTDPSSSQPVQTFRSCILVAALSFDLACSLPATPPPCFAFTFCEVVSFGRSLVNGRNSGAPGMYLRSTSGTTMPCICQRGSPQQGRDGRHLLSDSSRGHSITFFPQHTKCR